MALAKSSFIRSSLQLSAHDRAKLTYGPSIEQLNISFNPKKQKITKILVSSIVAPIFIPAKYVITKDLFFLMGMLLSNEDPHFDRI